MSSNVDHDDSPLWSPSNERRSSSHINEFVRRHGLTSYEDAWRWSTDPTTLGEFWQAVADETGALKTGLCGFSLKIDAPRDRYVSKYASNYVWETYAWTTGIALSGLVWRRIVGLIVSWKEPIRDDQHYSDHLDN